MHVANCSATLSSFEAHALHCIGIGMVHLVWRPESFILLLAFPESPVTMTCWKQFDAVIAAEPLESSLVRPADLQLPSLKFGL